MFKFKKKIEEPKEHTYYVTWMTANNGPITLGNAIMESRATGRELLKGINDAVHQEAPGATILHIFKAD